MQLYNKLSAKERAALIDKAGKDRITISFYQYHTIENPQLFRDKLFLEWNALDVLGRIYVSYEGINAQLSVPSENFYGLKDQLDSISFLKAIRLNVAIEQDNKSFLKLKVKVRNKIVADGLYDETFDVTDKGVHLNAKEFIHVNFYDGNGNRNSVTMPLGISTSATYDNASRLTVSMDANNKATSFAYDANDNMISETDAFGNVTQVGFDANDNMTSITNAKNETTPICLLK